MKVMSVIAAVAGAVFRVIMVVAIVYVIFRGAGVCYDYGYRIFTEPAISAGEGRTVTVTVSPDMSALEIGKLFESKGLVRDAKLFVLQYYLSEYTKDVVPGTFELSTAMTVEEMMEAMADLEDEEETNASAPAGGSAPKTADPAQDEGATGGMPPAGGAAGEDTQAGDSDLGGEASGE